MIENLRTASSDRNDAFYRQLIERAVRGLTAGGGSDLEAILMIGAPARGEATVIETPDGLYSLSDIDLVCVASADADVSSLRRRVSAWTARANTELSPLCSGVDASVRTPAELAALPPRIATYEMLRSPALLWGRLGERTLPTIRVEDVPAWDALVLVHNRIVEETLLRSELQRPSRSERDAVSSAYASGKLALDAITACLYVDGDVPNPTRDRVAAFAGRSTCRRSTALASAVEPYLPDLKAWSRFKEDGDVPSLAASLREAAGTDDLGELPAALWRRYAGLAEPVWRWVLGRAVGAPALDLLLPETARLYRRLESRPRTWARTLRMLRRHPGVFSTGRALAAGVISSPRNTAYLCAVLLYLRLTGRAGGEADDLIARAAPFAVRRTSSGLDIDDLIARLDRFHEAVLKGRKARTEA